MVKDSRSRPPRQKVLTVSKIASPSWMDQLLGRMWEVLHTPTGATVGQYRYQRTAKAAAAWLIENVPGELLAGVDAEAIATAGEKAGWYAFQKTLSASDRANARATA